ncbi:glycogen debranching protein GlgX [Antarcticirhabdus aurantiaca]|uniref:Glycogen debranching protein GlgX n=1 Tax=Antarcticirhabdus aurantiaca TaxID=2606717 RepID=A0ACD4NLZ9_9HYPH|nr:glycogen debranching protein GlgX [Antarcticirhabdus aurantiaca]WAJ27691.1 glycogen debranching protein GlgX [Jeongeuplla avenae]
MGFSITAERGAPARLGANVAADGVSFAVHSGNAARVLLCLFDGSGEREIARLPLARQGDTHFGFVPGLAEGARYGLRAEGPWAPEAGHRFDPSKLLVDPYAVALDRPYRFDPVLTAPRQAGLDSAAVVPRAVVAKLDRTAAPLPFAPPGLTYETSVRAFSMRHASVPERVRGTVAALAEPAVLDHLVRIGVGSVELMPLAGWIDEAHLVCLGLCNAWGYNPIAHMAPDPRLAPGGWPEIRRSVEALHARGLRVLLDVVLNHSGEGPVEGPTLAYRGLDNALYYRHAEGQPGTLVNDTGTGNTFACDRAPVVALFLECLRTWVEVGGIDGFRYDLGTVLGRDDHGFRPDAPLLAAIAADPVLKDRIHVAEPWDVGPGGYRIGEFRPPFLEWQDRFRDDVRRFWRGESGRVGALATRLCGSPDLFDRFNRAPSVGVNFVAAHDGFSLADIVAYETKHNEANGEGNRDGHGENHSWNNGVEGPTDDPAILAARGRDLRALLATLFLSRGTPMLVAGDEFGRTQNGNNNAYAQDNATTWLDWDAADEALIRFVAALSALRRSHPALRLDAFPSGRPLPGTDVPDVSWLRADGSAMEADDWNDPERRLLVLQFAAPGADGRPARLLLAFNAGMKDAAIALPPAAPGERLVLALQSDCPDLLPRPLDPAHGLVVKARSVFVVTAEVVEPADGIP